MKMQSHDNTNIRTSFIPKIKISNILNNLCTMHKLGKIIDLFDKKVHHLRTTTNI
jgi:hypothetical protein